MSGSVTITPSISWTGDKPATNANLALTAAPAAQVGAGEITSRELAASALPVDPTAYGWVYDDFLKPTVDAWTVINSTGTSTIVAGTGAHPGQLKLGPIQSAGNDYNGIRGASATECITLGAGATTIEWIIREPSSLPTGTDSAQIFVGLGNGASTMAEPTSGVYFTYVDGTNSGSWVAKTALASARTSLNSNVAVVASAYRRLKAVVNAAATSVEFFIDGTSIGTITTNIPTAALTPVCGWTRTAISATNHFFHADMVKLSTVFTTAR